MVEVETAGRSHSRTLSGDVCTWLVAGWKWDIVYEFNRFYQTMDAHSIDQSPYQTRGDTERVPLPKWNSRLGSLYSTTKPADGPWNIHRFRLTDRKLTVDPHVQRDQPGEWIRAYPAKQRLLPLSWGEIKSNRLRH